MRFFASFKAFRVDEKGYTKTMQDQLMIEFRKAALAFLEAASPKVPVDTGMARGSFLNIARLLRRSLTINPKRTNQRYYHGGSWHGVPKTPTLGQSLSTPQDKILTWNKDRTQIRFTFNTRVYHFNLNDGFNDFRGVNDNAPWGSIEAGKQAFIDTLRQIPNNKRLPRLKRFLIRTTISLGPGNNVTYKTDTTPIRENINVF